MASSVLSACTSESPSSAGPMRYRVLGRTGLRVSEIGFGGYPVDDPDVLHYAIDHGINYVDTAPSYRGGASEETIGKVMKTRRHEVVLATKWRPYSKTSREEMLESLNASLKRLQTDHVDLIQVHQVGRASGGESIERLQNPELFEAFEIAKRQGKARFLGVTGHDGDLMEVMNYALDTDRFDTILCRYSFLDYPQQQELFRRAKAQNIGVIAMKTLAGAKGENLKEFRTGKTTVKQAALKWVLSNPDITNLIISMRNIDQIKEYMAASGSALTREDHRLLEKYAERYSREYCRMCNQCEPACPQGVKIADILRYSIYFHHYGEQKQAMLAYAELPISGQAGSCLNCPAPCEALCPYGIPVRRELLKAHTALA